MQPASETRNWFFWPAAAVSACGLAALAATLVIGLRACGTVAGLTGAHIILYTLVALSFWLLGTLIGLLKPGDLMIRAGCGAAIATSLQLAARALDPVLSNLTPAEFALSRLLFLTSPLHFALALEFFYRFPGGPIPGRWWTTVRIVLWSFALTVWAIRVPRVWAWAFGGPGLNDTWVWPLEEKALIALAAAIAAAVIVNYRRLSKPDHHRRLQWIVAGAAGTLLPHVLLGVVNTASGRFGLNHPVTFTVELSSVLLPLTMTYAVLRHRTLGFQVILRQSLQYLLAKSVLWMLIALPIVFLVADIVLHADRTLAQLVAHNLAAPLLVVAAVAGLFRRERLGRWLDRKFFREAHDRDQVVVQLLDQLRSLDSLESAPQLIVSFVELALHPQVVQMFTADRQTGGLTLAHSCGDFPPTPDLAPASAAISQRLSRAHAVVDISSLMGEADAFALAAQAVLAVRLSGAAGDMLGMLLLGEKRSEEPYTAGDRNLLASIATYAGAIYDQEWLKGRLGDEQRIQRNVLAHLGASEINLVRECPVCGVCYDSEQRSCLQEGAELTLAVPVERVLASRYRLDRRLGRGAMGTVYLAFDQRLNRNVAVKVMMGSLFGNRAAIRRFEREAHAAARLNHPNIVSVHDYGAIGSDGAYLVMEHICGFTWRAALRQAGAFSPIRAANRMDHLIDGVKAAHAAGLVHRDLKPENVMIGNGEQLKVLDFGLAKLAKGLSDASELTVAGTLLGTAGYMSYEQLMGEEADERSDIFALGVMASEAVTGRRPFEGRTIVELANAILKGEWRLPPDPAVRAIIARCLTHDPRQRYASAAELQRELVPAMQACAPAPGTPDGDDTATTLTLGA